jgi:integrase
VEKLGRKIYPKAQERLTYIESFPEGQKALDKCTSTLESRYQYAKAMFLFCKEFMRKTPTQITSEYIADIKANQYEGFDKWESLFEDYTIFLKKRFKSGTAAYYFAAAKALINANVPHSLRLQAKTPESYSTPTQVITIEDLKEVYSMANVRERAFISVLKDSGMSADDALRLTIKDLEGFTKGERWLHIRTVRQKEHVDYETFMGPNAADDLRAFLNLRQRRGENITDNSPVFGTIQKPFRRLEIQTLKIIFFNLTNKTGISISTHRLRKFFETYMALVVRHPIILKYWMGHKIRKGRDVEARYIIPPTPEQLALYKEAYKNIDLIGATIEDRLKVIEDLTKSLTPEQRELMQKHDIRFRKRAAKHETNGGDCGENFEQISEAQLLSYLNAGWQIVHRLANGKVIVKR